MKDHSGRFGLRRSRGMHYVLALCYGAAVFLGSVALTRRLLERPFADYLQGARDVIFDAASGRVVVAALHANALTVIDVRGDRPRVEAYYADALNFGNVHGLAYDAARHVTFVPSYTRASLTAFAIAGRRAGTALGTLVRPNELASGVHAAYDARRRRVFVANAGSHGRPGEPSAADELRSGAGHSITVIDANDLEDLRVLQRLSDWGDEGERCDAAYPVYTFYLRDRDFLVASNDKCKTVEFFNASNATLFKQSEVYDARVLNYVSQLDYDEKRRRLYAASQKSNSLAVLDVADLAHPRLLASVVDDDVLNMATGIAVDVRRQLAFVVSEGARSFAVYSVADVDASKPPRLVGVVRDALLFGAEAIAYDAERRRAYVVSRNAGAFVVVDVRRATRPKIVHHITTGHDAVLFPIQLGCAVTLGVLLLHAVAYVCVRVLNGDRRRLFRRLDDDEEDDEDDAPSYAPIETDEVEPAREIGGRQSDCEMTRGPPAMLPTIDGEPKRLDDDAKFPKISPQPHSKQPVVFTC
ncbi:hypothetical protein M885DRAFT_537570 [Pelagophyceae sp. CCMP2097]|nr:hypothetical protein M885DRAFT_537570 [Pelagophyceae sp. CCMP2097]